jgi:ribulose 1,5-bisphosphate carboxylase large subunit-like protein
MDDQNHTIYSNNIFHVYIIYANKYIVNLSYNLENICTKISNLYTLIVGCIY